MLIVGDLMADAILAALIADGRERCASVLVDPKKPDYQCSASTTCVTPNFPEFQHTLLTMARPQNDLAESGHCLREAIGTDFLLVTQGAEGMTLFGRMGKPGISLALAQEVFDISGARDTVIAMLAACVGTGMEMETAMAFANAAASIVVGKVGTAPIRRYIGPTWRGCWISRIKLRY